jgi:hypothetical protein
MLNGDGIVEMCPIEVMTSSSSPTNAPGLTELMEPMRSLLFIKPAGGDVSRDE